MAKTAFITGGTRGIGLAIARRFAREGYNLALNYYGGEEAARQAKEELEALGRKVLLLKGDVSQGSRVEEMVEEILREMESIDVLVNNAGITRDGLLIRMKEEEFDAVISTNLKGAFLTMKLVGKHMARRREGRIINISSVVGLTGNPGQANYAAAKAGLLGITKTAAKELASRNILVNAVAPGFIETDMTAVLPETVRNAAVEHIPLGRFGQGEEIASAVYFLGSEENTYITGQVLTVDGGMVI